jgi:hypothetical protein
MYPGETPLTGNYFGNMKLGKQLADKAKEIAQEKEDAEAKMRELSSLAQLCEKLGFVSREFQEGSKKAENRFNEKEYRECIAAASDAIEKLNDELQKVFSSRIDSTARILEFLRSKGVSIGQVGEGIEQVRTLLTKREYESADAAITEVWSKEEKNLSELYSNEFSKVQRTMVEAKSHGLVVEGVDNLLSSARNEMTSGNYENAFRLLEEAGASIVSQFRKNADAQIKDISSRIEISRLFGLGISSMKDRLASIQALPPEQKFGEIESLLLSLRRDVDQRLRKAFEANIKTIRSELSSSVLSEAVASSSSLRIKDIERLLSEGNFEKAYSSLKSFEAEFEKAKYDYIARVLFNCRKYIADAMKNGADLTDINSRLNEVRELVKKRRFEEAVRMAELANEEARKLSDRMNQTNELLARMEKEYSVLVSLISNSVDIGIKYADARRKFEEKRFEEFIAESTSLLENMHQMLETFSTSQIDALDRKISALEYLGAETLELNEQLENAVSFVRNSEYSKCIEITNRMDTEIEARLLQMNNSWLERAKKCTEQATGNLKERLTKLLDETRQLQADHSYYRSACIAKDMVDWSVNGDVFRVQSLIHRSRRLISIFPNLAVKSATTMLDSAERQMAIDLEGALKTAGEAHDVIYGLIADYFSKVMSDLMGMVSTARRKKIEIGYGYNLIGRARAALKFEDFETANKMVSLAKDEIRGKLSNVDEIAEKLEKAERQYQESRKLNIVIDGLDDRLNAARNALKHFDYPSASLAISEVLEMEDRGMSSVLAPKEVMRLRGLIQFAGVLSLDVQEFEDIRVKISNLMRERNHYDALLISRKTVADMESVIHNALDSAIKSVSAESARAEIEGIDVKLVESRLDRARELLAKGQYEQAFSSLSLADKELNFSRNAVTETAKAVQKAESFVEKLDELGIIDGSAIGMLRQSKTLLSNEQHLLSLQTAQKCTEICTTSLKNSGIRLLQGYSVSVMSLVSEDKKAETGKKIDALANSIQQGSEDAVDGLLEIKDLNDRLKLQKEMAERTLDISMEKIESARKQGVETKSLTEETEFIRSLLSSRRYREVIEKGIRIEQILDDLLSEVRRLKERVDETQKRLQSYEEVGVSDSRWSEDLQRVREFIRDGRTSDASALLASIDAASSEKLQAACVSALNGLEKATAAAEELGIEFRPGMVEQARKNMIDGRPLDALSISSPALKDISFVILETLQGALSRAVDGIGYPDDLKKEAEKRIEGLVSEQRYEEAVSYLRKIRENAARKAEISKALAPIREEITRISRELRNAGVNLRNIESRLNAVYADLPDSSAEQATQILEELKRTRQSLIPRLKIQPVNESGRASLRIVNAGKAVALAVTSTVSGSTFRMNESIGNLKPGQERRIGISSSATGDINLEIRSKSLLDEAENVVVKQFRMDGGNIQAVRICRYCRGRIREGVEVYECRCGREYHRVCSTRTEKCECGMPVEHN